MEPGAADDEAFKAVWPAYSTNVEIFIALRDVDYHYSVYETKTVKSSRKTIARKVVAYLKPPGSLQWVEKCITETVFREKSPKFATKLFFQFEERDAAAISIKFDVHDEMREEPVHGMVLGSIEVKLQQLINAGSSGIEMPILSLIEPYKQKGGSRIEPGRIFLRSELLKQINYAVLLKFGLRMSSPKCFIRPPVFPYYFEVYKLNEQTLFEISHPYTLIHRSELIKHSGAEDDCWNYIVLPVARICNGDMGRVLKLEVYQADHPNVPKGFALTTLRKMLIDRELAIPINRLDGKISHKICLYAPLCHEVPLHPFHYYLKKGLTLRRVFATDFSSSNWNVQLHRRALHDIDSGRTPYEEAIIMAAGSLIDVAQGDSVFYSFGIPGLQPFEASLGDENHIRELLISYKEALYRAKMSVGSDGIGNHDSGATSIQPARGSITGKTTDPPPPPSTHLTPLLNNIAALLSVRADNFDYHIVFIFTDGQISDVESSMQVIINLAKFPVSLVFIGIGMGDLHQLLTLEKDCTNPQTGEFPCRKIVHVIHFRSLLEWDSAIRQSQWRTSPPDLFRKEIFTVLRDQMPAYMRIFQTAI